MQYIQDLGPNPSLDLKTLTLKLCMLIALIAASRQHEIQLLDPSTMSWFHDRVVCYASKLTKGDTQNTKKEQFKITLEKYSGSQNLDVVSCLEHYLNVTNVHRQTEITKKVLFLSYVEPYHAIKPKTVANWLKMVMLRSGIDTSVYKAHSTRSAAASGAVIGGATIKQILKLGNWSRAQTFRKFYEKSVEMESESVQSKILTARYFKLS